MKKTKKYDYAENLSDGYPVVNIDLISDIPNEPEPEVKSYIPEEPPYYGKPNKGYEFIVKYGKIMKISTLVATIVFFCLISITLFMINIDVSKSASAKITVSTTYHNNNTNTSVISNLLNKKIEKNTEMIALVDSMMETKRLAALEEQEKHKQHIRDSLARYIHVRDSIRTEILKEDSIKLELERAKKVKIDYIAVIDDGITKRTVNVNSVADSLTPENTEILGKNFHTVTYQAVIDRQNEINKTRNYYKHLRLKTESLL